MKTVAAMLVLFWRKYITESYDYTQDWLSHAKTNGASHVVVVWSGFEMEEFPVFVRRGDNPEKVREIYNQVPTARVSRILAV